MVSFTRSSFSEAREYLHNDKVTVSEIIELIDTTLVKLYADYEQMDELYGFFDLRSFKRNHNFDELDMYLTKSGKMAALALMYEHSADAEKALKIWRKIGNKESAQKSIELMQRTRDKGLIREYDIF